jgi:hypothetical protein
MIPQAYSLPDPGPPLSPVPGIKARLMDPDEATSFAETLPRRLREVDSLLASVPESGSLDRMAYHMGQAIWTADPVDRFFHAWRVVEVVSEFDFGRARDADAAGNPVPADDYLRAVRAPLLQSGQARIGVRLRIERTLKSRLDLELGNELKLLLGCRDRIAHGSVRTEEVRVATLHGPRLLCIADLLATRVLCESYPRLEGLIEVTSARVVPNVELDFRPEDDVFPGLNDGIAMGTTRPDTLSGAGK